MASKTYGLPYMGSKNKIAEWVVSHLPKAENFYDLFCGGGAITHCAMTQGKYNKYTINDIEPTMPKLFVDAVNGLFKNEDRWISREQFFELKDSDPYARLCFSFGNNHKKGYAYSKTLEPIKRALHYAIVFGDNSQAESYGIDCSCMDGIVDKRDRRLALGEYLKRNYTHLSLLSSFENAYRLLSLERLDRFNIVCDNTVIKNHNLSYDQITIAEDSVVYCDIPYFSTASYNDNSFNYEAFYNWCEKQTQRVFISEYWMPEDRFVCIAEKSKLSSLSATNNSKQTIEKIFVPKHQERLYIKQTLF